MKSFYVITNKSKDRDGALTESIVSYLREKGMQCGKAPFVRKFVPGEQFVDPVLIPEDTEAIIVLGGDGTILKVARETSSMQIPIVGVNLGGVGYLADIDSKKIYGALDKLINDNYMIESRMMISGDVYKRGRLAVSDAALNDIVISRGRSYRMVSLKVYINDSYLATYHCDGLITSTPTGSTGYSLSIGGPIVDPTARTILVAPIAPHTLTSRCVVLPPETKICIEQDCNKDGTVGDSVISFDGDIVADLNTGNRIEIKMSEKDVKLIRLHKSSFLDLLSRKMG